MPPAMLAFNAASRICSSDVEAWLTGALNAISAAGLSGAERKRLQWGAMELSKMPSPSPARVGKSSTDIILEKVEDVLGAATMVAGQRFTRAPPLQAALQKSGHKDLAKDVRKLAQGQHLLAHPTHLAEQVALALGGRHDDEATTASDSDAAKSTKVLDLGSPSLRNEVHSLTAERDDALAAVTELRSQLAQAQQAERETRVQARELATVVEMKKKELQDKAKLCGIEMHKLQKTHDKERLTTLDLARRIGSILSRVDGERGREAAEIGNRITAEDLLGDLDCLVDILDVAVADWATSRSSTRWRT